MTRDVRPFRRAARIAVQTLACLALVGCERITPESDAGGTATLDWTLPEAATPSSVAGYKVFYGTSQRALYTVVVVPDPRARRYVVSHLAPGTWYFAVAAYTRDNVQGTLSNVVSKAVR